MKINMPVTNNEIIFKDDEFMLTKTNLKGVITYTNQDFVNVSGFSEEELVGSSHNIVRHPDMPVEAFADLWTSLKAGQPWTGMIKNRTKSGDFYWVEANAAPIFEDGVVTGYLSARRKPSRQQVEAADAAYRLFKEGRAKGLRILEGKVINDDIKFKIKRKFQNFSVNKRMFLLVGLAITVAIALIAYSIYALSQADANLKNVYESRMVPVRDLSTIESLRKDNVILFTNAVASLRLNGVGKEATLAMDVGTSAKAADGIAHNAETITVLWKGYIATEMSSEEKILADKFGEVRGKFVAEVIEPGVSALRANNYAEAKKILERSVEVRKACVDAENALIKLQFDGADSTYKATVAAYEEVRMTVVGCMLLAMMLLIWIGMTITRSITQPLKKVIDIFGEISSNNLSTRIDVEGDNELSDVLRALKITQTMLNVNLNEQKVLAKKIEVESIKYESQLAAIAKSSGVIEFDMSGKVIAANDIVLNTMGYSLNEVLGQHHSIFVLSDDAKSEDYKQFWEKLNNGEAVAGEFRRLGKGGHEVWLQASYNPILDATGKPFKVVLYATDVTAQKLKNADFESQIDAISKSQGVVEMAMDGTVLKVNDVYLQMVGYTAQEMLGKNVSMVIDPTFAKSAAYTELWNKLVQGGTDSGQYKRITKGGREVWIQASYNPIYDLDGKPCKVVNYTIDITAQKVQAADFEGQITAISKVQGVIEFTLDGKITAVNENFANVTGYSEKEIVGNHHSMFVESAYKSSHEYKAFWDKLGRGEAEAGQYKRLGKGGNEIWLQASYNPIFDMNGKPFKVVKYATDITGQHNAAQALELAVEETQHIIESAKAGDLSDRVPLEGKTGAIASLCDGVNALMDKMTEVIIQVREAGETINTAAGEISSGNTDLSSRTEQQASSLEETASSMEELASTVKQNAENAKQANQLASAASGVAVKGGEVVGQVVNTMSAINTSAKKIEDIISVIDGIAFQTNILALNAAVEAARAGEQGRGFAVVAGEVRNLAQRSASAAKEIKELITDSVNKTAQGTAQVETAGKTMQEIVSSVQRVTDIMGEIAAASIEQSAGIDQVNNAITSMDEVTQQNAALVEQAAAAAESLVDQAVGLMDTVNAFNIVGGATQGKPKLRTIVKSQPERLSGRAPAPRLANSDFSFEDAKTAHIKWKTRLVDYVAGRSTEHLEVDKVCRDDQCPLGGWIYGKAQKYVHTAEYKELKAAHAEFHQSVGNVVKCVHDNKQADAKQLLGGEFSKTSKRTINAIDNIQASVNGKKSTLRVANTKVTDDGDWEEF